MTGMQQTRIKMARLTLVKSPKLTKHSALLTLPMLMRMPVNGTSILWPLSTSGDTTRINHTPGPKMSTKIWDQTSSAVKSLQEEPMKMVAETTSLTVASNSGRRLVMTTTWVAMISANHSLTNMVVVLETLNNLREWVPTSLVASVVEAVTKDKTALTLLKKQRSDGI